MVIMIRSINPLYGLDTPSVLEPVKFQAVAEAPISGTTQSAPAEPPAVTE